uniref:Uncharacterized protein n=1 Tax=Soybean thrips tombus-like virus 5 TaxID=2802947 RepID=A0A7T8FZR5_9TOMB|nr:hypothetical protein 1 [Soybean thrips tombus-like virus 5]
MDDLENVPNAREEIEDLLGLFLPYPGEFFIEHSRELLWGDMFRLPRHWRRAGVQHPRRYLEDEPILDIRRLFREPRRNRRNRRIERVHRGFAHLNPPLEHGIENFALRLWTPMFRDMLAECLLPLPHVEEYKTPENTAYYINEHHSSWFLTPRERAEFDREQQKKRWRDASTVPDDVIARERRVARRGQWITKYATLLGLVKDPVYPELEKYLKLQALYMDRNETLPLYLKHKALRYLEDREKRVLNTQEAVEASVLHAIRADALDQRHFRRVREALDFPKSPGKPSVVLRIAKVACAAWLTKICFRGLRYIISRRV